MTRAFTQLYFHATFSTRQRAPLISSELESKLFPVIGGIVRDLRCKLIAINGMPDHLHVLIRCPADISLAEAIRHIKGRSSKWIHDTIPELAAFGWQGGYGGFTVSRSMVTDVENYIRQQKDHHRRQDFRREFLELLRRHGIESDQAEVFD